MSRQETLGREWAATHHPDLPVLVFEDQAVSGTVMDRPGWEAFTTAVRVGKVTHVWCYEQSRITRGGQDTWDQVCVLLSRAGIGEVHTYRQGAISVRQGNRLLGRFQALMDQEEREIVQARTLDTLHQNAREGRPHGAVGFGHRRSHDGRPGREPDPQTAPIVREMVDRVARGESLGTVARWLNARGVPTPQRGRSWSRQSVRAVVSSPRLIGQRVHRGVVSEATWEPIVERSSWEQAQARLAGHRPALTLSQRRLFLLSGVAECGRCGGDLVASQSNRVPMYVCPGANRGNPGTCGRLAIHAEPVEREAVARAGAWLENPEMIDALDRLLHQGREDTLGLRRELDMIDGKLADMAALWAAGERTDIEYQAARRVLAERRVEVESVLFANPAPAVTAEVVRAAWRAGEDADRREVMRMMIRVEVSPGLVGGRRVPTLERLSFRFPA